MDQEQRKTRFYRKSTFVTHLPVHYLYSPTHYWLEETAPSHWRVGLTRFSTRMLGNLVDFGFEVAAGSTVRTGGIIGWIEGFKAITDVYCVGEGTFRGINPDLEKDMEKAWKNNYSSGWFFEFEGRPDPQCMGVDDYVTVLDTTIDRILEQQKNEQEADAASGDGDEE